MDESYERLAKLSLLKKILDQRDTIRVARTPKGEFSFEVKRHYDFNKTMPDEVIQQIKEIYNKLKEEFRI
jgi:hypothetical protein